jgi:uncharacterized membrane protein
VGIWGILAYQWLGIGMGAWGIYAYARRKIGNLAWLSMLHYWGMWDIYRALPYDVHPEILGPCLVPWIFYALETKKRLLLFALTSWLYFQSIPSPSGSYLSLFPCTCTIKRMSYLDVIPFI